MSKNVQYVHNRCQFVVWGVSKHALLGIVRYGFDIGHIIQFFKLANAPKSTWNHKYKKSGNPVKSRVSGSGAYGSRTRGLYNANVAH